MALSYQTRRRLSLLILVLGLPAYIVVALVLTSLFERPSFVMELAIYVGLGLVWILPLRPIFRGVGRPDPEKQAPPRQPENGPDP